MSMKVTDRIINLIKYNYKINFGGKLMGWAKYDEDNREIMEERWNDYCNRRATYPNSYSCATITNAGAYQPKNSYKSTSYSINTRKI